MRDDLRDISRDIREIITCSNNQTSSTLLIRRSGIMNDLSLCSVDRIRRQVCQSADVGMSGRTVITFVIIVSQNFPIVIPFHLPKVIKDIVFKMELLVSLLRVDAFKVILPRHFRRLLGIEIDPDEARAVNVHMNRKQTIILLLKSIQVLITRSFGQFPIQSIRPSVVFARENSRGAGIFGDDGKGTMSTDVVETIDFSLSVFDEKNVEACDGETEEIAGGDEAVLVREELPFPGENGSSFELVHFFGLIPAGRESSSGIVLVLFFRWRGGSKAKVAQQTRGHGIFSGHDGGEVNVSQQYR